MLPTLARRIWFTIFETILSVVVPMVLKRMIWTRINALRATRTTKTLQFSYAGDC